MRIAILGGGFTGLSAAYYLANKGHSVTILEREKLLGGLAVGFKEPHWQWPLERAYHHLFDTDSYILNLAKDSGFDDIFFSSPETASLYKIDNDYRTFPVDTPQDFFKLPFLNLFEKVRAAAVLAFLKFGPLLPIYEKYSAKNFFSTTMGEKAWNVVFEQPMRKKFGKYADNILASFIWARVKVRGKALGYVKGGFQTFVQHLEKANTKNGVIIKKGHEVKEIKKSAENFQIEYQDQKGKLNKEKFDTVISTLPIPIMNKVAGKLFSDTYLSRFKKLKYLNAVVLIIENKEPLLQKTYWLSICVPELPLMFVGQHTNFIDKKYYGNNHLLYAAKYVDFDDELWKMNEQEIIEYATPQLKIINPQFKMSKSKVYIFKAPYAQPVFDKDFLKNKPDFITPQKNFFIANLDMTYPNDRGTNYAVKLGKDVSDLIE